MMLTGGTAIGLVPFVIIRFSSGELWVGLLDAALVVSFTALYLLVRLTRKTFWVSFVLTFLALFGNVISSYLKGPSQVYWLYPTMIIAFYLLPARIALGLNALAVLLTIPAYAGKVDIVTASSMMITFILTNVFAYVFSSQMKKQQDALRQLSIKDSLTEIGNRRALMQELINRKNDRHKQMPQGTACLILMDIDHFKAINDSHGHLTGDDILKGFTQLLQKIIPRRARVFRYGGEEFVVILECDQLSDCWNLAEKIRQHTQSNRFVKDIQLTVSLGVAEIDNKESLDDWINRADEALYRAKNSGRNQTCLSRHQKSGHCEQPSQHAWDGTTTQETTMR